MKKGILFLLLPLVALCQKTNIPCPTPGCRFSGGPVIVDSTVSVGRALPVGAPSGSISTICLDMPGISSVVCNGATGSGAGHPDATAWQSTINAACAFAVSVGAPPKVVVPWVGVYYWITTALSIPDGCNNLEIDGTGAYVAWYGATGGLFEIHGAIGVRIHGFNVVSNAANPTWFVRIVSNAAIAPTIWDNQITLVGNASGGGGVSIEASPALIKVSRNVIVTGGTGIKSTGSPDACKLEENDLQGTGRGIDMSGGTGATAMQIHHNIFVSTGGHLRLQGSGEYWADRNETELSASPLTNGNSASFEFLGPKVIAELNRCQLASQGNYCIWMDDTTAAKSRVTETDINNQLVAGIRNGSGIDQPTWAMRENTVATGTLYTSPNARHDFAVGDELGESSLRANDSFGLSAQRICHAQYSFATDGGAVGAITPANNCTLPANSVITNIAINSTTAVTSGGSATVSVGTTAGSSATSLLAATAKASFSINAFVQGGPVPQTASTWVKLSAQGQPNVTVATTALTAGVIELYIYYYVSGT